MENNNIFNRKRPEKLNIELDGGPHGEYHRIQKEELRHRYLEDLGFKSTTPAASCLCNALTIIVLRPPLLQKEGRLFLISAFTKKSLS
jgi:hypothetical protein